MKRIDIKYGGLDYSIGGRRIEDVEAEIEAGVRSGVPTWLTVNLGEGRMLASRLLITTGVEISLIPIDEPDDAGHESQDPSEIAR